MAASPRRALLAWEMGEGLGHAFRLLAIARRLRGLGWEPVVAARNTGALADRYAAAGIPVMAAPSHESCFQGPGSFRAATFADVMGVCGYADRSRLTTVVGAWDAILDDWRPEVVIADYSPLLSLACFGRVPLIGIGDGFVTPPSMDGVFPPLGTPAPAVWDPCVLLDNARAVQAARGMARPDSLAVIMAGMGQVVATLPEIDIYAAHRATPAAGPWQKPAAPLQPPDEPRLFAYLRAFEPLSRMVLQAAVDCRLPMECFLHGAAPEVVSVLRRNGMIVHRTPPPLADVLARCSLLIHHGGMGTLEEAALLGRPQVLLPRHLEQGLNASRAVEGLPGTVVMRRGITIEQVREVLPRLLAASTPVQVAYRSAQRLHARPGDAWTVLEDFLERL